MPESTNSNPLNRPPDDPLGAFCTANHVALAATASGSLDGLRFAAKDVMDIAGSTTGFGQPSWLSSQSPAATSAEVIEKLLAAGARLVGRTISDELSYSLSGENYHYGTPVNPSDPTRIPGGSSSGSVSAVAGGLVDFALGTDCAGSVRLPASYCGIYGMRPTHGRVCANGVIPFAPSFDTVGWFARDASTLASVGKVLLDTDEANPPFDRLLIEQDSFALIEPGVAAALRPVVERLQQRFPRSLEISVSEAGLNEWMECFRTIQAAEIWTSLGDWIVHQQPQFGPGINERIAAAREVTQRQADTARATHRRIQTRLNSIIEPGDVICLPSSPRVAPLKGTATSTVEVTYRYQAIGLLSVAGLGGLPQISMPLASLDGLPLGISLAARRGTDCALLDLVCQMQDA